LTLTRCSWGTNIDSCNVSHHLIGDGDAAGGSGGEFATLTETLYARLVASSEALEVGAINALCIGTWIAFKSATGEAGTTEAKRMETRTDPRRSAIE
jgi:hypothetical protein